MAKCTAPKKGHRSAAARAACPVCGVHRAGRSQSVRVTAAESAGRNRRSTAASRSARETGSVAGVDFVVWIWLALIVDDRFWLLLVGVIAVGLPAVLAAEWTYQCSAWVNDGTARCRRSRAGFMQRCHDHDRAVITQYDVAAGAAAIIAVINALILVGVLLR